MHLQILSKGSRLWWGALLFLGILIVPVTFHLACYIEETGTDSFHPITPNFSVPNSPLSLTPFTQPKGNPPIDLPPVPGAYDALWNHTFGGPNDDMGYAVIEVSGGGFAIAGHTWSFGAGVNNGWLIRLDANGNQLWNRTYGGYDWESCFKVIEVSGGGFALAGYSTSYDAGSNDFWLLRVDANGNHLWNHTYGGALPDGAMSVLEVSSGGFILCGNTASFGVGDADVWVVRTDADGNHLWNQTYGSINYDMAYSVIEVSDGGFALAGLTNATGGVAMYGSDMWLIRTDANGNHLWNQTYGGANGDMAYSVVELSGGDLVLSGTFNSSYGIGLDADMWLVRTDTNGNHLWNQTYGGPSSEMGGTVVEMSDGGFAFSGLTDSSGAGGGDVWLVRTDTTGNELWNHTYGGTGFDLGVNLIEVSSGGFALTGWTNSSGAGNYDIWVLRVPLPRWVDVPSDQLVELGTGFSYDLNAASDAGIHQWWVDDTTYFAIDSQGVVTNASLLPVDVYGLQVGVNDTLGNVLTTTFTVTVQDTTSPTWVTTPVDQVLAAGLLLDYQLEATDLSGIDQWSVDDTTNFAIDNTGHLTGTTPLGSGDYSLTITVTDPYDNELSATITVTQLAAGIPGFPVIAIGLGVTVALCLGIITRRKRRRH
ncbi:MAG: cadherin repeat domain-containing protein [Candidatus Hermodarchaeota archaeon]|nr:cadherin repeat domain-containing protein [Candidatus Hermodarchaeota archaeon]